MRRDRPDLIKYGFALPPFTVSCTPSPDPNNYLVYAISADGVPVRQQSSYPEIADGWIGLAFTLDNHDKTLTPENEERLLVFKVDLKQNNKNNSAYGGTRTSTISKHYVFSLKQREKTAPRKVLKCC
mgnify:CR=1 FL=1